jgi:hypothetical protein
MNVADAEEYGAKRQQKTKPPHHIALIIRPVSGEHGRKRSAELCGWAGKGWLRGWGWGGDHDFCCLFDGSRFRKWEIKPNGTIGKISMILYAAMA